jgi:hypothetical protein
MTHNDMIDCRADELLPGDVVLWFKTQWLIISTQLIYTYNGRIVDNVAMMILNSVDSVGPTHVMYRTDFKFKRFPREEET